MHPFKSLFSLIYFFLRGVFPVIFWGEPVLRLFWGVFFFMGCLFLFFGFDFVLSFFFVLGIFLFAFFFDGIVGRAEAFFLARSGGRRWRELQRFLGGLKLKTLSWRAVLVSVVFSFAFYCLYFLLVSPAPVSPRGNSIVSTVFLHPVWEEFIFRGLIFGGVLLCLRLNQERLKEWFSLAFIVLLFFQAVFFGFLHGLLPFQVFQGFALGLLFVGHKRIGSKNNLWPPIIAHATHNAIVTLSVCFLP